MKNAGVTQEDANGYRGSSRCVVRRIGPVLTCQLGANSRRHIRPLHTHLRPRFATFSIGSVID